MALTLEDFKKISDPIVKETTDIIGEKAVSDIIDEVGNQYVNLVQKGGGVLGIALVGYTSVLEGCGIRFLRLAGTSAGAINTAIIAISEKPKSEIRSDEVIEILSKMEFFKFVDGNNFVKWFIKKIVKDKYFIKRIKSIIYNIIIIYFLLFWLTITFNIFFKNTTFNNYSVNSLLEILLAFISIIFIALFLTVLHFVRRFKNKGMGLNPGNYFYTWIKELFDKKDINTVSKLNERAFSKPKLELRPGIEHIFGSENILCDVTFICSDLVTENKIEFPSMIDLFRTEDEIDNLHPASFIRASMSVPLFFNSFYIGDIPNENESIKTRWYELFNEKNPPKIARIVDGGVLSDFPMSIFYRSQIRTPRIPTFGIDLDDSDSRDTQKDSTKWSFEEFLIRLFNTARFYYDKEFLLKNRMYSKGVGKVPLKDFNWLNFFMSDQEKLALFEKGALAAKEFLIKFNWDEYKKNREEYHDYLNSFTH